MRNFENPITPFAEQSLTSRLRSATALPKVALLVSDDIRSSPHLQAVIDGQKQHYYADIGRVISANLEGDGAMQYPVTGDGLQKEEFDTRLARIIVDSGCSVTICINWTHAFEESFLKPIRQANISVYTLFLTRTGSVDDATTSNAYGEPSDASIAQENSGTEVNVRLLSLNPHASETSLSRHIRLMPGESATEFRARVLSVESKMVIEGVRLALNRTEHSLY